MEHSSVRAAVRWGRFNLVGLGGFIIQVVVLAGLTRVFGWRAVPATTAAVGAAIAVNYIGHVHWTWADRPALTRGARMQRALVYQAASLTGLFFNVLLTAALVRHATLPVEVANVLAVGACAFLNFLSADRLVFRAWSPGRDDSPDPRAGHPAGGVVPPSHTPGFPVVAPCQPGASPLSVRRRTCARGC